LDQKDSGERELGAPLAEVSVMSQLLLINLVLEELINKMTIGG